MTPVKKDLDVSIPKLVKSQTITPTKTSWVAEEIVNDYLKILEMSDQETEDDDDDKVKFVQMTTSVFESPSKQALVEEF